MHILRYYCFFIELFSFSRMKIFKWSAAREFMTFLPNSNGILTFLWYTTNTWTAIFDPNSLGNKGHPNVYIWVNLRKSSHKSVKKDKKFFLGAHLWTKYFWIPYTFLNIKSLWNSEFSVASIFYNGIIIICPDVTQKDNNEIYVK